MSTRDTIELISFKICPFVQRSAITLLEKDIPFQRRDIDLEDPPQWFREISPLGKVPVLRMGERILFESAVINEYLDEITPPSLHPTDPYEKARHRAWIEFGSEVIGTQYGYYTASDGERCAAKRDKLRGLLAQAERQVTGPLFAGQDLSLVDAAWAPVFMRQAILERRAPSGIYTDTPRVAAWATALLERRTVTASVAEDFETSFLSYIRSHSDYWAAAMPADV